MPLHLLEHVLADVASRLGDYDTGCPESLDFAWCVAAALYESEGECTLHDGACMAHAPARGSRNTGDEPDDGLVLLVVFLNPVGGLLLDAPADLADHDDA